MPKGKNTAVIQVYLKSETRTAIQSQAKQQERSESFIAGRILDEAMGGRLTDMDDIELFERFDLDKQLDFIEGNYEKIKLMPNGERIMADSIDRINKRKAELDKAME